jgi:hypothetical protein
MNLVLKSQQYKNNQKLVFYIMSPCTIIYYRQKADNYLYDTCSSPRKQIKFKIIQGRFSFQIFYKTICIIMGQ